MSSIEKLSIRGIRSFSPGREEMIEFNQALTVILGANGMYFQYSKCMHFSIV